MKRTVKTVQDAIGELTQARDAAALKAKNEGFDKLTPEERSAISGYAQAVEPLNEELVALRAAEEAIARTANVNGGADKYGLSEGDIKNFKQFSLVRGLQLLAENKPLDGVEAEVHSVAVEQARANKVSIVGFGVPAVLGHQRGQTVTGQTTTAGDQGGVTVETSINGMVEQLWQKSWLPAFGARRLTGLVGDPEFLVQETKPTIQELTEIEEMDDDEILMSKFKMQPARRGTAIPFSKQTLLQASIDVESLIMDNIRKGLDYKLNAEATLTLLAAITSGNGNLLALGTNGAAPTYDHMVDLEALIDSADALEGIRYLTNTKVKAKLKKTQQFASTNGAAVYQNGQINEYPAVISNIVPSNLTKGTASGVCSAIIAGNGDDFYFGMWGGLDFVVDEKARAKKAEILVVANAYWQTKVARVKSFAGIKDALTA